MIRSAGLILILVLGHAQDDEAARLILQLQDDDIDRRDQAEHLLRKLGSKASSSLEKAVASADRELSTRARNVLQAIKDDLAMQAAVAPVKLVSVHAEGLSFRNVFRELDNQTGFTTRLGDKLEDKLVTLHLVDRPYLEVVDLLCEAHGSAHLEAFPGGVGPNRSTTAAKQGWFEVLPGKSVLKPTSYPGPFRMRIEYIQVNRPGGLQIGFSFAWQPDVHPINGPFVVVNQAVDDLGHALADEDCRKTYAGLRGMEGYARREVESHRTVYFFDRFPSADATKLTRVKGGALINIALEDLALEYLISDVGAKRDLGQYTLEFTDFKAEKSRANSRFTLSRLDHTALESVPMGPIDSTNFELLDRDGKPLRWSSHGPRLKDGKCIYEKSWTIEEGRVPAKIRLRYLSRSRLYEIPFEFANVSLPP